MLKAFSRHAHLARLLGQARRGLRSNQVPPSLRQPAFQVEKLEDRVLLSGTIAMPFDPDGLAPDNPFVEVSSLDHKPGNTLAVGGNTAIANFISGSGSTEFDMLYQAKITSLLDAEGAPINVVGLNAGFELTAVAGFTETVVGAGSASAPNSFVLSSNPTLSYFEIYYDPANNANDLAGTGFNDGRLILAADLTRADGQYIRFGGGVGTPLDAFVADNYPAIDSILAVGAMQIEADVTFADSEFFGATPPSQILFAIFNNNLSLNYSQTDPSAAFVTAPNAMAGSAPFGAGPAPVTAGAGLGVASLGLVNGAQGPLGGPDVQLQSDGTHSFATRPAQLAQLGDFVWHDLDADGIQDAGEPGIPNVQVKLQDAAGNVLDTTTTDADGFYLFSGLVPGDYKVMFMLPPAPAGANWMVSPQNQGSDDAVDSDGDPVMLMTAVTTLSPGESDLTLDQGFFLKGSLHVFGFEDMDADGLYEPGEGDTAFEGKKIDLFDAAGNFVASQSTNAAGQAWFLNLAPGTYTLLEDLSIFDPNDIMASPDPDGPGGYPGGADARTVTITSGEEAVYVPGAAAGMLQPGQFESFDDPEGSGIDENLIFGNFLKGSIHAFGFEDQDGDGNYEPGEGDVPYENKPLELRDAAGNAIDFMFTDASGQAWFLSLMPGTYTVVERVDLLPPGVSPSTPASRTVTVKSGEELVWKDGAAMLDPTDPQHEVLVGTELMFGNTRLRGQIDIEKYIKVVEQPSGGGTEGLTPGFWKTHSRFGPAPLAGWPETGFDPQDSYEAIFGVDVPGSSPTLLQALQIGGGGYKALLRQSAAALLNAANPNVDYAYTQAQVITMVKQAFASGNFEQVKDLFEVQNEKGADLSTPASGGGGGGGSTGIGDDADSPTGPVVKLNDQLMFTYVVTNPGQAALANVTVVDDNATPANPADDFQPAPVLAGGFNVGDTDKDNLLDVGEEWRYTAMTTASAKGQFRNLATVTAIPVNSAGTPVGGPVTDEDPAHWLVPDDNVPPPPPVKGDQGLTPGFWKQSQHFSFWTGFKPGDSYEAVFGVSVAGSNPTLLQALQTGGGGVNALLRHSTAALLNAANPNVNYAFTQAQVITMVKQAFANGTFEQVKDQFEAQNEKGNVDLKSGGTSSLAAAASAWSASSMSAGALAISGNSVSVELTNDGSEPVYLQGLVLEWVKQNKKLKEVRLDGVKIAGGADGTSANISSFTGHADLRSIGAGQTLVLTLVFEKSVSKKAGDYDLGLTFSNGQTITI